MTERKPLPATTAQLNPDGGAKVAVTAKDAVPPCAVGTTGPATVTYAPYTADEAAFPYQLAEGALATITSGAVEDEEEERLGYRRHGRRRVSVVDDTDACDAARPAAVGGGVARAAARGIVRRDRPGEGHGARGAAAYTRPRFGSS